MSERNDHDIIPTQNERKNPEGILAKLARLRANLIPTQNDCKNPEGIESMYQEFAKVYDRFMQSIPSKEWADYLESIWRRHAWQPNLVLDLACGTGSVTVELAKRGYDMLGADISPDMLEIAQEKAREASQDILFLMQDMREFELYGTVDSVISTCDSMNYMVEEEDLEQVFRLVENYLDPQGLFVFDMKTPYLYREVMGERVFADTTEDAAFIWQNYFYEEEQINEYQVTFFYQEGAHYTRREETHYQKAYPIQTVLSLLEKSHLKIEGVYDAFTFQKPSAKSECVCFVAREQRKEKIHE